MQKTMRAALLTFLVILVGVVAPGCTSVSVSRQATTPAPLDTSYKLSFALGMPATPQPADPLLPTTDISVHARNNSTQFGLAPMDAQHGAGCEPFPETHRIQPTLDQSVYICHDHLMTAISAPEDQGVAIIQPDHLLDFSAGAQATITMPISTLRTSGRDWLEFWLTPFAEQLATPQTPFTSNEYQGPPKDGLLVQMGAYSGQTPITAFVCKDFQCKGLPSDQTLTFESALAAHKLKPDASRRDTYQIDVSENHVAFSLPQYGATLLDAPIPGSLGFSQAVFQLIQRSYNPSRQDFCATVDIAPSCAPDTWHIGGVAMSRAVGYTLLKGGQRIANANTATVSYQRASPAKSYLRFAGMGSHLAFSVDGGKTWVAATQAPEDPSKGGVSGHYENYLTPIPAGVTTIMFRGVNWFAGPWEARNPILLSLTAPTK